MNHTPNFGLNLPEGTDLVKVSDLNENFSIIDSNMGGGNSNFIVNYSFNESTGELASDKTFEEISMAYSSGSEVFARVDGGNNCVLGQIDEYVARFTCEYWAGSDMGIVFLAIMHQSEDIIQYQFKQLSGYNVIYYIEDDESISCQQQFSDILQAYLGGNPIKAHLSGDGFEYPLTIGVVMDEQIVFNTMPIATGATELTYMVIVHTSEDSIDKVDYAVATH